MCWLPDITITICVITSYIRTITIDSLNIWSFICMVDTECLRETVARGAKGNPWIFREIAEYLETGRKPPRPSADELKAMILRHGQMMLEFKGETAGMREMRKHVAWYTAGYPNSAALRNDINTVSTMDELTALIGERL